MADFLLRDVFEHSPLPIYVLQDGYFKLVNPQMVQISGYSSEELLTMPFYRLIHPDDRQVVVDTAMRRLSGENVANEYEFRAVTRNNETIIVRGYFSVIKMNERPAILGQIMDVTDYKQTENALRESEAKYRTILGNIQEGYFEVDLSGNFTFVNYSTTKILGMSKDELMGINYRQYTINEKVGDVFEAFNKVYRTGKPTDIFDWEIVRRDGSRRFVETSISLLRDAAGNPAGFMGIVRDITKRKQAEMALRRERDFNRAILETAGALVTVLDPECRVVLFNRACELTTGYKAEEIKGQMLWDVLIMPEEIEQVKKALHHLSSGARQNGWECHWLCKNGDRRLIDWSNTTLFNEHGVVEFIICTGLDITERRRAEEELQREKEHLAVTLNSIGDGVIAVDKNSLVTLLNPVAETLTGWTAAEAKNRPLAEVFNIINEHTGAAAENPVSKVLAEGRIVGLANHTALIARNGVVRSIADSAAPIMNSSRQILGVILVFRDVTEERKQEEALRASEERFRLLAEQAMDIIFRIRLRPRWQFDYVSPAATEIIGYSPEEHYNDPAFYRKVIHPDDLPKLERLISSGTDFSKPVKLRLVHKNGTVVWTEQKIVPIYDQAGNLVAMEGIARDVTERQRTEEKMRYLSLHDPLTGLYNRAYFEQEMNRLETDPPCSVGVIVCDVNGLKLVNDTLGHDTGDQLLVATAGVIKKAFREGDTVARIGGDEFAILLPGCSEKTVETAYHRIMDGVAGHNRAHPGLPVNISAGYSYGAGNGLNLADLFKEADNNMYREKLYRSRSARSAIVQTLMKALEARDFITEGHADRLQNLVIELARAIGLSEHRLTELRLLAQFHDLGKVGIPDRILFKPGPLTAEEAEEMKRHCEIGHRIALTAHDLVAVADWILKHHEWWNGKGYPLGISGEEIPLECRILAIADAYDAMTSDRPYRKARSHAEALRELQKCAGTQFDPYLVRKFVELMGTKSFDRLISERGTGALDRGQ